MMKCLPFIVSKCFDNKDVFPLQFSNFSEPKCSLKDKGNIIFCLFLIRLLHFGIVLLRFFSRLHMQQLLIFGVLVAFLQKCIDDGL